MFLAPLLLADTAMGLALGVTELATRPGTASAPRGRIKSHPAAAAERLLTATWNRSLAVDLPGILAQCKLTAQVIDIDAPTEGYFLAGDDNKVHTLVINKAMSLVGRRYAVAHMLGHMALKHTDVPMETRANFSLNATSRQERDANEFALNVLIPTEGLEFMMARHRTVEKLTQVYGVSPVAMTQRINAYFGIA